MVSSGYSTQWVANWVHQLTGDYEHQRLVHTCEDEPCLPGDHPFVCSQRNANLGPVTGRMHAQVIQECNILGDRESPATSSSDTHEKPPQYETRAEEGVDFDLTAKKLPTHGVRFGRRMICRQILPCSSDKILGKEISQEEGSMDSRLRKRRLSRSGE